LRDAEVGGPKLDSITEYLLNGTFTSVQIASVAALLVLQPPNIARVIRKKLIAARYAARLRFAEG
jgi:hypothetical protein